LALLIALRHSVFMGLIGVESAAVSISVARAMMS
jgi:hypothetical protein